MPEDNVMKQLIIMVFIIVISCQSIYAQETLEFLRDYDKDTIYLYNNYLGKWYVKDGQILPIGRFGKNLQKEIMASKFSVEEMEKARYYAKVATITGFSAGLIGFTRVILEIFDVEYPHRREAYISMIASGVVLSIVSKGFYESSVGAMNRAVWIYNRDVLSGRLSK